ncbi:HAMP domain-containing histidine kinase [Mesorhizobium sp. M7A.F.Ca.CA.001.09.2.1]|uniref:histidine kinase n=3 Tax=Mesorhizobium TaxID=68287 RepID=A0AB38T8F9_9HYPH|nr:MULTISPECIES: HAMP domain-containing sensor histidine kinase [Mesorhizobium]MDF3217954.1 HAMP domain-containing sensor histidine kinase [Mesorhizobium ciceri]RUY66681.1 HAMP domain-containing histidine kinase [Mesorhizobium sp. M7A.F.Ca.CA.001.13.1.1]RUY74173.1 HAMP domain-containing histidine kinase [Mesorhizobium sp. M7A.F.Ca.CA.001.05.1.1]RUY76591.1 HAMP domain-containing histidine kinase [Mesorhizobium sp. M7A.F.Ca.CA.001.09.2.1]RUZ00673.1 HAMP domain-containing histidine kinase [Mesorh
MNLFSRLRSIPVSYRVPALVAILMVVISATISERVLDRLSRTQEGFLDGLAETYLDGLSSAVVPAVLRGDVWEVYDALDRSSSSYEALSPIETVVTGADGRVLAATDPTRIATFSQLPERYLNRYGPGIVTIDGSTLTGFAKRDLIYQGHPIGAIHATFDVSHLFAERREILVTLLVTNGVLAILFSLGGFLLVRRMIAPMRVLENHMRSAAHGAAEPIASSDIPEGDSEVAGLFRGYNMLVHAERERANFAMQLAEEEKLSSLGRLASGMAHEINNPLGGLFNALDTLKTHGQTPGVRETSISLIERGLAGIRDVVEAALATYRPERSQRPLTADDFDDVRLLLKPELHRRRQRLDCDVGWSGERELPIRGGPVRQAVLNLLLNASTITPEGGSISLRAHRAGNVLTIEIGDQGPGMPGDIAAVLIDPDPGPAVRAGRGLGLWMVRRVVDDLGGSASIVAKKDGGTAVMLTIPFEGEVKKANAA